MFRGSSREAVIGVVRAVSISDGLYRLRRSLAIVSFTFLIKGLSFSVTFKVFRRRPHTIVYICEHERSFSVLFDVHMSVVINAELTLLIC